MAKYYKMDSKEGRRHRKIYDFLVSNRVPSDKAYKIATKLTNWA